VANPLTAEVSNKRRKFSHLTWKPFQLNFGTLSYFKLAFQGVKLKTTVLHIKNTVTIRINNVKNAKVFCVSAKQPTHIPLNIPTHCRKQQCRKAQLQPQAFKTKIIVAISVYFGI
jgi:hypothetical protein